MILQFKNAYFQQYCQNGIPVSGILFSLVYNNNVPYAITVKEELVKEHNLEYSRFSGSFDSETKIVLDIECITEIVEDVLVFQEDAKNPNTAVCKKDGKVYLAIKSKIILNEPVLVKAHSLYNSNVLRVIHGESDLVGKSRLAERAER